jgi:DNA-binding response OmpR family regulator
MEKAVILVADDDREIVFALAAFLEAEGYKVFKAYNGAEVLDIMVVNKVDLLIIDIIMPKLDGFSAIVKIREHDNIPILVLSAKSEDSDKILGLGIGADDYITKPYNPLELLARVQSLLRRSMVLGKNETGNEDVIVIGRLTLDKKAKNFLVDSEPIKITATEYSILELLMENKGRVFSSETIYNRVWNEDAYNIENTVMVHIRHIREKIEINPKEPEYLKVVWGIGYKIEG